MNRAVDITDKFVNILQIGISLFTTCICHATHTHTHAHTYAIGYKCMKLQWIAFRLFYGIWKPYTHTYLHIYTCAHSTSHCLFAYICYLFILLLYSAVFASPAQDRVNSSFIWRSVLFSIIVIFVLFSHRYSTLLALVFCLLCKHVLFVPQGHSSRHIKYP